MISPRLVHLHGARPDFSAKLHQSRSHAEKHQGIAFNFGSNPGEYFTVSATLALGNLSGLSQ